MTSQWQEAKWINIIKGAETPLGDSGECGKSVRDMGEVNGDEHFRKDEDQREWKR